MVLITSNGNICLNHPALINVPIQLPPEHLLYLRDANNILAGTRIFKYNSIFKLKKRNMHHIHVPRVCRKPSILTTVPIPSSYGTSCYPYQHDFNYPTTINHWDPLHTPLLNIQPVLFNTNIRPLLRQPIILPIMPQAYSCDQENIYDYTNEFNLYAKQIQETTDISHQTTYYDTVETTVPPGFSTILPQTIIHDEENILDFTNELYYNNNKTTEFSNEQMYCAHNYNNVLTKEIEKFTEMSNNESYNKEEVVAETYTSKFNTEVKKVEVDPIETYLQLPKSLFPSPKMLTLDPNPMIDEFCKMKNFQHHIPWLLDLELGVPKSPTTRPIPIYNVKFNSIHCKNAPDAIHPGFESCDPDFKRVLKFYYDCIVSAWYKGYITMYCDVSVENFQSWLLLPMQVFGMGWA